MSREYTYKGYQNHISQNVSLGIDKPNNISRNNGQLAQFAWNGGQPDLSKLSQLMNCMEIDWGDATWDGTEVNIDDLKNGNGIANVRSSYDVLRLLFWCVKQHLSPAVQYTITYNIDGGSGTAPASQTVSPGTVIQLPTYSGTKSGYNSKDKWIIGSQEYAPGSNYTVNSNVTAKWKWEVIPVTQYTVTFIDRGTTLKVVTGPTGNTVTPPSNPTRSGYNFIGWNTNQNASTSMQVISTIGTSNVTYYAIWEAISVPQYTVTFIDRGTTLKVVTGPTGNTVTPPSNPTRSGYDFMGWNTNQNANTGIQVISTIGTSNVTYYAIWKEQVQTAYYWYVGATAPTSLPTNDSNLATGTNSGWRKIGNGKPSVGTQIFSDDDTIIVSTTKVPIYIAVNSDINLRFEDTLGNEFEDFVGNPTISNGMKIYTTLFRAKSFNGNVKIS